MTSAEPVCESNVEKEGGKSRKEDLRMEKKKERHLGAVLPDRCYEYYVAPQYNTEQER